MSQRIGERSAMPQQTAKWQRSTNTYVWIFDVGRGLCLFIRTPLNHGILYDLGASDEFRPVEFLLEHIVPHLDEYAAPDFKPCPMAQVFISHPHADHISDLDRLLPGDNNEPARLQCGLLTCPHDHDDDPDLERLDLDRFQFTPERRERYRSIYAQRTLPLQTIQHTSSSSAPNLEYGLYYVRPPVVHGIHPDVDQDYGNGVSLVVYYRHGAHSILMPGDITPKCMSHLLQHGKGLEKRFTRFDGRAAKSDWHRKSTNQPGLCEMLGTYGLSVLLAPHHGLESCYSPELYNCLKGGKPGIVVISDKRHIDGDGKIDSRYQCADGAHGTPVYRNGAKKSDTLYSVSTRQAGHMLIKFTGNKKYYPSIYVNKDPAALLGYMT